MARQVQIKRMGPDFAERSAKVVSKYSYTMPQKNPTNAHNAKNSLSGRQDYNSAYKSLRTDETPSKTLEISARNLKNVPTSPYITKIADGLELNTFGNDRAPFFSQYDREQANRMEIQPQTMVGMRTKIPSQGGY